MRGHSHSLRPVFVEMISLHIRISPSSSIFVYCDDDPADVNSTKHPEAHVNMTFCNRLTASRHKLVSVCPGFL